jgi:hypothetical protein
VNIVVRVDSPGNDGPVTQTNSSVAGATAGNANNVTQTGSQTQSGGAASGQAQQATQTAPTTQGANAAAASTQVNPLNVNIVIRNKSPGDEAGATQTNSSQATANAGNTNAVTQGVGQTQTAGGAAGGQSQVVVQNAPTTQTAGSTATSTQTAPANGNISVTVEPATDPGGYGGLGTVIKIWIPATTVPTTTASSNTSSATATASNSNAVTQTAQQTQTASSTQAGGQSQVVVQNAPTTQNAGALATSTQLGGSGGSTLSTAAETTSHDVSQAAEQTQVADDPGIPTPDPSAGIAPFAAAPRAGDNGWMLATAARVFFAARPRAWSPRRDAGRAAQSQSRPGAVRRDFAPSAPKLPAPEQAPAALGAAAGGSGGGSLGVFAAFLLPLLLTVPWGTGRPRPSAVRRLMGVVSRLERPG